MLVIQEKIVSIEEKLSLGFSQREWTLFRTFSTEITKSPFPGQVGAVWFMMSLDQTKYIRTIYGFWDLLADVGGLNDILVVGGGHLFTFISFLIGSGLDRFLV